MIAARQPGTTASSSHEEEEESDVVRELLSKM